MPELHIPAEIRLSEGAIPAAILGECSVAVGQPYLLLRRVLSAAFFKTQVHVGRTNLRHLYRNVGFSPPFS